MENGVGEGNRGQGKAIGRQGKAIRGYYAGVCYTGVWMDVCVYLVCACLSGHGWRRFFGPFGGLPSRVRIWSCSITSWSPIRASMYG